MHAHGQLILLTSSLLAAACDSGHDAVEAGYYGPDPAGSSAPPAAATPKPSTAPQSRPATTPTAASTPSSGMTSMAPSTPAQQPMAAGVRGSTQTPGGGCDMSGRWLCTLHTVTDALGQLQYAHTYVYYEFEQQGDAFTVKKGLHCGDDAVGAGAFAVTADFRGSWDAVASRVSLAGRTGKSAQTSDGCSVELEKWYTVRGATIEYYSDPATTLPSADQMATEAMPGWEDWDNDGNPGLTGMVSGVVTGKIFVAPRQWTQIAGVVPDVSSLFKVPLQWNQEPNVMSYDGTPLLGSEAARAADATLHFAQFARLSDAQGKGGTDAEICHAVTQLAQMLTPEAAGM